MEQKEQEDFKSVADIIKQMRINYNSEYENNLSAFFLEWNNVAGEQLATYSKPETLTQDGILIIKCQNSVVANEIFKSRAILNEKLKNIANGLNINTFKYIKIVYG